MVLKRKTDERDHKKSALRCETCRATYNMPAGKLTAHDHICPLCNFQVSPIYHTRWHMRTRTLILSVYTDADCTACQVVEVYNEKTKKSCGPPCFRRLCACADGRLGFLSLCAGASELTGGSPAGTRAAPAASPARRKAWPAPTPAPV